MNVFQLQSNIKNTGNDVALLAWGFNVLLLKKCRVGEKNRKIGLCW